MQTTEKIFFFLFLIFANVSFLSLAQPSQARSKKSSAKELINFFNDQAPLRVEGPVYSHLPNISAGEGIFWYSQNPFFFRFDYKDLKDSGHSTRLSQNGLETAFLRNSVKAPYQKIKRKEKSFADLIKDFFPKILTQTTIQKFEEVFFVEKSYRKFSKILLVKSRTPLAAGLECQLSFSENDQLETISCLIPHKLESYLKVQNFEKISLKEAQKIFQEP